MINVTLSKQKDVKEIVLSTQTLSKVYDSGGEKFQATRNIDLDIYTGDFTVIMGSSGSGKSTLLYMLSGLDQATSGKVYFKGQSLEETSEKELSKLRVNKIGFIYQSINLVPDLTLKENISFPGYVAGKSEREVSEKVTSLMKKMDILEQKDRLPSQVSGGQQQRAAIARALVNNPEILFADEPTGALSVNQGKLILDILTDLNEGGQSIVMVTHDLKAASRANRIILIKDGAIENILELPKYRPELSVDRENQIYAFMSGKE